MPTASDISKIIESVASLLWPLIVILVILAFRPAVSAIVDSARSRKFTLKIGGQELTMEEVNDQQQKLIADLQAQIVEIRRTLQGAAAVASLPAAAHIASTEVAPKAVLWADDNPKNNSYIVQQLADRHVKVDQTESTREAMSLFRPGKYAYIISDMGRQEGRTYNPHAGIDLLKALRQLDQSVPVVIFCSARAVKEYGTEARAAGAAAVTSSSTELFGILGLQPSTA